MNVIICVCVCRPVVNDENGGCFRICVNVIVCVCVCRPFANEENGGCSRICANVIIYACVFVDLLWMKKKGLLWQSLDL